MNNSTAIRAACRNILSGICLAAHVGLIALLIAQVAVPVRAEETPGSAIGRHIDNFVLSDYRSQSTKWSLQEKTSGARATVVLFLGTECPLVKLYAPRLEALHQKAVEQGVVFVGINANQQDSLEEVGAFVRRHKISFPMLKDAGNVVADQFGAQRTPEVFVLDAKHTVRYHGRIDDQFVPGIQSVKVRHDYLADALQSLIKDDPVPIAETEPVGCHIGRVLEPESDASVTYAAQISRILQNRCVSCHRAGEIAPFALTDYEEVVGWAQMIDEVVRQRRMPPWHADPQYGEFINDARLPDEERELIHQWVAAGAPLGDPEQLPPPAEFPGGWQIGEPDQIVYMSDEPFKVPAEGEVEYQYFTVDPGFTEDKWIKAAECRPGNRAVVHHIIVAPEKRKTQDSVAQHTISSDWIAATAPGARPMVLPDGMAKFVPAGSKLVFQMHYTPIGTPQEDRSCVGLVFADPDEVHQKVYTRKAINTKFKIKPNAANFRVDAKPYEFDHDSLMLAMFPHMHLRGKAFRYTARYPDGREEILLDVPHYDFNWQNSYEFVEPKRMPKGTKLFCTAYYDNSADNLANPDPTRIVGWGDQTNDEMMIGYFNMTLANQDLVRDRQAKATPLKLTTGLRRLSHAAADSNTTWRQWAVAVREQLSQLDRIDLLVVRGKTVTVERVAQEGATPLLGKQYPVQGLKLVEYARQAQTQLHANVAAVKSPDFELLSQQFASSVHVPTRLGDDAALVSFWSREPDAFSSQNARDLTQLVELLFQDAQADD